VRRPDFAAAADELRALGATLVVRPDELRRSADAAAALRALPPPKLGAHIQPCVCAHAASCVLLLLLLLCALSSRHAAKMRR
jgi:hypothetical protein